MRQAIDLQVRNHLPATSFHQDPHQAAPSPRPLKVKAAHLLPRAQGRAAPAAAQVAEARVVSPNHSALFPAAASQNTVQDAPPQAQAYHEAQDLAAPHAAASVTWSIIRVLLVPVLPPVRYPEVLQAAQTHPLT